MLLVARAGREREVQRDLREVGPRRGRGRARHRRRADARCAGTDEQVVDIPVDAGRATRAPMLRAPGARARRPARAQKLDARRRRARARSARSAARSCSHRPNLCVEALDVPAVRPARAGATPCSARAATRRWCGSSARTARRPEGDRARGRLQPALVLARPVRGRDRGGGGGGAQRRVHGRAAARAHRLPELRQPGASRDHVAVRRGDRGHRRGVPRARHAGRVGERVVLQRDATGARSSRRPRSAWSACSTTGVATPSRTSRGRARDRAARRERRELGGSECLALRRGLERGVPPEVDLDARAPPRELLVAGVARARSRARTTSRTAGSPWRSPSAASPDPARGRPRRAARRAAPRRARSSASRPGA